MKLAFISAKSKINCNFPDKLFSNLTDSVVLCSSIQFIDLVSRLKLLIESKGKSVSLLTGQHSSVKGQILGCDVLEHKYLEDELSNIVVDNQNCSIIYIGDGLFHPKAILFGNPNIPVYQFNPFTEEFDKLSKSDVIRLEDKRNVLKNAFRSAKTVGIIESTKFGQRNLSEITKIRIQFPEKKFYKFICDSIDFNDLINFMYIDCWINTACPRIAYEDIDRFVNPIINPEMIIELMNKNNF